MSCHDATLIYDRFSDHFLATFLGDGSHGATADDGAAGIEANGMLELVPPCRVRAVPTALAAHDPYSVWCDASVAVSVPRIRAPTAHSPAHRSVWSPGAATAAAKGAAAAVAPLPGSQATHVEWVEAAGAAGAAAGAEAPAGACGVVFAEGDSVEVQWRQQPELPFGQQSLYAPPIRLAPLARCLTASRLT